MRLTPSNITIIRRLLVGRGSRPLRSILTKVDPSELVALIPLLSVAEVRVLIDALQSIAKASEVLSRLSDSQLEEVLSALDSQQLLQIMYVASVDDAAHFLSFIPEEDRLTLMEALPEAKRQKIQLFLSYPEDSSGRLMIPDIFTLPSKTTVAETLEALRSRAAVSSIYYIYCTDDEGRLDGVVSVRQVAIAQPDTALHQLFGPKLIFVYHHQPAREAAELISRYGYMAIPVVDESRHLLGLVTVDEIVDRLQEQATAEVYAQAGLTGDERVYTPASRSIRNRTPWMFVNLALAAAASGVVSMFEETMAHLIVLATLKNIVAGLAGNTAIQTLTVFTRGLAVGDFKMIDRNKAVMKELVVGVSLGLIMGVTAGLMTFIWKGNLLVSVVIFLSMILNSFVAAIFGAMVPLILKKFDLDPATGSGVIVTQVTDAFSFFSFLAIAGLALRLFGQ
jgi:magnesium transporter